MAVTINGTNGITFNDTTVQGTAPVLPSTNYNGIGSYVMAYYGATGPANQGRSNFLANGTTMAGSSLRVSSRATGNDVVSTLNIEAFNSNFPGYLLSQSSSAFPTTNTTTLSGTWRLMQGGAWSLNGGGCIATWYWMPLLWVRIS